jgi:hypothetical protein
LKKFYPLVLAVKEVPRDKELCNVSGNVTGVNLRQPGLVHFFPKMYATTIQPSFSICGCMVRLSQLGSVRRVRGESQGID